MDASMFDAQVDALRDEFRCLTWDERGHGETGPVSEPFTYWDSARDALGILDALGVRRAVLAGMSQGGFLSLRAALLAPDRVDGLVLIDSQAGVENPDIVPAYQALIDEWAANGPSAVQETVASLILGRPDLYPAWYQRWAAIPKDTVRLPGQALLTRDDITDRLSEIACPTLVVHGDADVAITIEKAEALCAGLPGCEAVVIISGGTHASNLTNPEAVNRAIGEFLRRLSPW
jgi:pimeloyl-ACP methyl ester carboxylesterase